MNVAIGYGVALASQAIVFPLLGVHAGLRQNIEIRIIFTIISIVRSYTLRWIFNFWHIAALDETGHTDRPRERPAMLDHVG